MMQVSERLAALLAAGEGGDLLDAATIELYRGQCNCSYWHGAFGGVYLPHLRNAVYQQLIAADNLLDQYEGRGWEGDRATGSSSTRTTTTSTAARRSAWPSNRLKAFIAPGRRRPAVRTRRAEHLPQPAGDAQPPPGGVPPQGAARPLGLGWQGRQHPRPRGLQAGRPRPDAAVRQLRAQEPGRSLLRHRRLARRGRRERGPRAGRLRHRRLRCPSSAAARSGCRCSSRATATSTACR